MKISDIEIKAAGRYMFVQVHTDDGITGLGEIGTWGYLDAAAEVIRKFKKHLVGQEALDTEHLWQSLYRATYFRGSVILGAISAIDIALWDIKGKHLGVPVYQLMGGKCREKVRVYVPVFEFEAEAMAKRCHEVQKRGFTAARLFIPVYHNKNREKKDETFSGKIDIAVEKIRACREAVGPYFDLCIEIHRSMSVPEAITFAREIEKYNPYFIEDPIAPDDMDAMVEVAQKTRVPVATGERAINIQEFAMLVKRSGAQYLRPDVCAVGGLTAAKKICSIAEAHSVEIVPHNPLGPVSTAACLQLDACISNFGIQEFPSFNDNGSEDAMVKTPLVVEDGYLLLPDSPGIGVELVEDVTERFPPAQRELLINTRNG